MWSRDDNPISYITNGVHVPTFLAQEWSDLFDRYLGHEWRNKMCDTDYWADIDSIPDHLFWSVRQSLKSQMFHGIRSSISEQNTRNHGSEAHLDRLLKFVDPINPNVLTLGFARRFATYKRAALLFENLDWLRKIILDQDRPVLLIFAGKAHPADVPGQDVIRRISQIAQFPEFEGRLLLIEGYDLRLARRLVAGVDVWLNNPIYPLEASGTSGMKAGINGVINLSVLDGWWLQRPLTVAEVSDQLFGEVKGYGALLALEEAGAHVEYLYQRGLLSITNIGDLEDGREPVAIRYQAMQCDDR